MPKAMLQEMADKLRSMAEELESYAGEEEGEEDAGEEFAESEGPSPVESKGGGSSKIKMAAAALRKGMGSKY